MNIESEENVRPTVLLVEDKPVILQQREEVFRSFSFDTVVAENYKSALAKFRATPGICLLATDINLDAEDENNREGIKLAEEIHSIMPELPLIALSGVVSEKMFKQSKKAALFKDSVTKGSGGNKLRERVPEWRKWAIAYLQKRIPTREAELRRLKTKYAISDYDFNLMREFVPLPLESSSDLDALLSAKGFRLRIIETTGLPDECVTEGIRIQKSIALWIHQGSDGFVAEVFGFPQLYASGASEQEAIGLTLILMHGFYEDLRPLSDDGTEESDLISQLRHYLESVFSSK